MEKTYCDDRFLKGEVILIDKPLNWTSFDVVNKVRYHIRHYLGIKRFKVGHAGTLDPLASGLLILCVGPKTKSIDSYQAQEKEYTGIIELGRETPSYDLETETCNTHPYQHITQEMILETCQSFIGIQKQMPPIFSAKKIDGKRAYNYAREKKEVEMTPREITIPLFEITRIDLPFVYFRVICSKGTYIRSIAHDFGKRLNNGGCLTELRRTRIGDFHVDDAMTIPEFISLMDKLKMDKLEIDAQNTIASQT